MDPIDRTPAAPVSSERARPQWLVIAVSLVVPGVGHLLVGRRRRSAFFLVPTAAVVIVAVVVASRGTLGILDLAVRPEALWWAFGMNLGLLVLRALAALDVVRLATSPRPGGWVTVGLVVVAGVIAVPHTVLGVYSLQGIDLLQSVFSGEGTGPTEEELFAEGVTPEDFGPPPPTVIVSSTATVPPPPVTIRPNVASDQAKDMIPESDRDPVRPVIIPDEPVFFDAPFEPGRIGNERITVLLAGGDAGPGRSGLRTDVMMVATFDPATGKAAIFGVPRNLAQVPLPDWMARSFHDLEDRFRAAEAAAAASSTTTVAEEPERCNCFADIINALYVHTHPWINTFPNSPDPGMEALRIALGGLLGLRIDYYVLVDFAGFVDVIDALGGVDVMVTEAMDVGFSPAKEGEDPVRVDVEPGLNHLDGRQALAYVRDRTNSSDYVRMARQRCMLAAMAEQADPATVMVRFSSLAAAVKSATTTDIPLNLLPDLVRAVASLDTGSIATVAFQPPYYAPEYDYRGAPIPDSGRIQAAVRSVIDNGLDGVRSGASECP